MLVIANGRRDFNREFFRGWFWQTSNGVDRFMTAAVDKLEDIRMTFLVA